MEDIFGKVPNYAILLNITNDHLDWHGSMQEYIKSKLKIFNFQEKNDFALINKKFDNKFKKNKYLGKLISLKLTIIYIRIKNITLGYNFSNSFTESLNINSARIYFTGTNLFTFTDYTGFDPEANASTSATGRNTDSYAGVDLATYPSQKKITLGLDIKF